jgi:hypothetical protein
MRALASFVMQGQFQAMAVVAALALFAVILPPLGIISAAAVGLVTLRQGPVPAVSLVVMAGALVGLAGLLLLGQPLGIVAAALLLWLPMLVLGTVLRLTRSLAFGLEAALLFGVLLIGLYSVQAGDATDMWKEILEPVSQALLEAQVLTQEQRVALLDELVRWMPGILATGFVLQMILGLFLARGWQAQLYNPGGFRAEFHALRLHAGIAYLALLLWLFMLFGPATGLDWVRYLGLLLLMGFSLQGLAVVHGGVAKAGLRIAWLAAVYVLLFLAMSHALLLLAGLGMADHWIDFRARIRG